MGPEETEIENINKFLNWIKEDVLDIIKIKIKSVAYSSQGSHIGQLDFCNLLADGSTTG